MTELEYKTTIWAEMKPDLYDEARPRFECFCEGDMDSDYVDEITLNSKQLPPGTVILVQQPCCPECGQEVDMCKPDEGCDFDWDEWCEERYL